MPARENGFEERVRWHFRRGICELTSMASCLSRGPKDDSEYRKAREHTERASEALAIAEALVEQELQRVDSESLKTMVLRKKLADEQKKRKEGLAMLQARLGDLERQLQENLKSLIGESSKKEQAKRTRKLVELKAKKLQNLKEAALWSMLVPPLGAITGGILAFSAHKALKKAEENVTSAKKMIDLHEEKEQEYLREVEMYAKMVKEQENMILENELKIKTIEEEKHELAKFHRETVDLQEAVRQCSHFVGLLGSKANVVHITSQFSGTEESLGYLLNEMNMYLTSFLSDKTPGAKGQAILSTPQIRRSIQQLKSVFESHNLLANVFYDIAGDLLDGEKFPWHFILYVVILVIVLAIFFYVHKLCWFYLICFCILCIFI